MQRLADVVEHLVDDLVQAHVDLLGLRERPGLTVRTDVEADDGRVGDRREVDVRLGDPADGAVHERQPHLVVGLVELAQRVGERFERAVHVGLEHQAERCGLAPLHHREDVLEPCATRERHRVGEVRGAAAVATRLGDRAGDLLVRRDAQLVARERDVVQTEHLDRRRRARFGDLLARFVEHGADLAPAAAGDDGVADAQRAALDDHRGDGTAALVQVGLEHERPGRHLRVRRERRVVEVGEQQDRLEQLVDAETLVGRDLVDDGVAAPLLGHELLLDELLLHPGDVGVLAVDLGDRDDHRDLRRAGVADRLDRLGHDAVVRGHHEHHDVGRLGAAGAHGGERLVARGVDEGDRAVVLDHLVRTDVLGDATGLTRDDVRLADAVEQRGLAVVDVTHDGDDRRARLEQRLVLVFVVVSQHRLQLELGLLAGLDEQDLRAELLGDELDHLVGERLRSGDHLAGVEQDADEVRAGAVELGRELLDRDAAGHHDLALGDGGVRRA